MVSSHSGSGAGAYFENCEILMINNIIFRNSIIGQPGNSGGVEFYGTSGYFGNNAVIENDGSRFGGLHFYTNYELLEVKNTIIWGNFPMQISTGYMPMIELTYCDIQDTVWAGIGNISVDPFFRDPENGDFHLMSTACGDPLDSPCIDAGDPNVQDIVLACDWGLGTITSDMGAYGGGDSATVGILENYISKPGNFILLQNFPNPFNTTTTIEFTLLYESRISLEIYDILGREVEILVDKNLAVGSHTFTWSASGYNSGLYFYRLRIDDRATTKKMVLLK